jgi:hypothetical protein
MNTCARLITFYLPQFHPIPENDQWWSKGFTEWTNVAKAKPLFHGHEQPHLPADLGFYDLRVAETRQTQAELAREHGIEGFCYWHYWFAGNRLLERPFDEVLQSGKPDFPFCLAWANQSWTGIWHGAPDRVLVEQTYPGLEDHQAHFRNVLPAFADDRYLRVDGKPIFVVLSPRELPNPQSFTDLWRQMALQNGLKGLYLIGIANQLWDPLSNGFDAAMIDNPGVVVQRMEFVSDNLVVNSVMRVYRKFYNLIFRQLLKRPRIYDYAKVTRLATPPLSATFDHFPCVIPNWDNTPRSGRNGLVFRNSTPALFKTQLKQAIAQVANRPIAKRVVFIKSWNEWAEGNYLEPDQRFGLGYLQVIKDEIRLTLKD